MDVKPENKKPMTFYIRMIHRNVGYLVIGLSLVYALSGLALIYRDTNFLKSAEKLSITTSTQMVSSDIARDLRLRRIEVTNTEGDVIHFHDGTSVIDGVYDKASGRLSYTKMELPRFLQRFIGLHKTNSSNASHWIAVLYGSLLLFLALSGLGMFKTGTRQFYKGMVMTGIGVAITVAILAFV